MAIYSIYMTAECNDSGHRASLIKKAFPDYQGTWTDKNFWYVPTGQEVEFTTGEKRSWDKDMIHVVV